MWGVTSILSFFSGGTGRVLLFAGAVLLWTQYQRADATRDCEDEQLRVSLEQKQAQIEELQAGAAKARKAATETQKGLDALRKDRDDLLEDFGELRDSCGFTDDQRERLRAIRPKERS